MSYEDMHLLDAWGVTGGDDEVECAEVVHLAAAVATESESLAPFCFGGGEGGENIVRVA